ncbi:hypothetical protein RCL1_005544 [Eukaryota sp. TZLM3-RCL]
MNRNSSSYSQIKASSRAHDAEEQRKANLLKTSTLLCLSHLNEAGYFNSTAQLQIEASNFIDHYELADNLSLSFLLNFYTSHHENSYHQTPVLLKKSTSQPNTKDITRPGHRKAAKPALPKPSKEKEVPNNEGLDLVIEPVSSNKLTNPVVNNNDNLIIPEDIKETFGSIVSEVTCTPAPITFKEIAGLFDCKRVLFETVLLPLKKPQLFLSAGISPPSSILLYGSPGCGKTLLARAAATESGYYFLSFSGSTIVSKWRGESEKVLRAIFTMGRKRAPCIVFVDEIDAIFPKEHDHEATRRSLAELLVQLDGITSSGQNHDFSDLFFMAATNRPYDLDDALLRRFHRKLLVPPPNSAARKTIISRILKDKATIPSVTAALDTVVSRTNNWCASDLVLAANEALMMPVRRAMLLDKDCCFADLVGSDDVEGQNHLSNLTRLIRSQVKSVDFCGEDLLQAFVNVKPSFDLSVHDKLKSWGESAETQ